MMRHWTAKLIFSVEATDYAVAVDKVFALLMQTFLKVRDEGQVYIHRPAFDLTPPHRNRRELNGGPVRFPPPIEQGEKWSHTVETNILYMKAHHQQAVPTEENLDDLEWREWEESTHWIYDVFGRVQMPDVHLLQVEKSIVFFD